MGYNTGVQYQYGQISNTSYTPNTRHIPTLSNTSLCGPWVRCPSRERNEPAETMLTPHRLCNTGHFWYSIVIFAHVFTTDSPPLTHCGLVTHMATNTWINIGSDNGLLPDGTKPLSKPSSVRSYEGIVIRIVEDTKLWYEIGNWIFNSTTTFPRG